MEDVCAEVDGLVDNTIHYFTAVEEKELHVTTIYYKVTI